MGGHPAYPGSRVAAYDFKAQTVLSYYRTATGDAKASSTHQHGAANDSVTRWRLRLKQFAYEINHRLGAQHKAADAISLLTTEDIDQTEIVDDLPVLMVDNDEPTL